jgi:hypothetical protein
MIPRETPLTRAVRLGQLDDPRRRRPPIDHSLQHEPLLQRLGTVVPDRLLACRPGAEVQKRTDRHPRNRRCLGESRLISVRNQRDTQREPNVIALSRRGVTLGRDSTPLVGSELKVGLSRLASPSRSFTAVVGGHRPSPSSRSTRAGPSSTRRSQSKPRAPRTQRRHLSSRASRSSPSRRRVTFPLSATQLGNEPSRLPWGRFLSCERVAGRGEWRRMGVGDL